MPNIISNDLSFYIFLQLCFCLIILNITWNIQTNLLSNLWLQLLWCIILLSHLHLSSWWGTHVTPHNTLLTIRGHFFSLPLFSALSFSAFLLSQQVKFLIYFFWGVESLPFLISFALFCTFFFNLYYSSLSLSFWWYFFAIYSLSSLAIAAAPFTIFLHSLSFLWPLLCTFLFLYSNFLLF